jgi:hypothetical protein
MNNETYRWVINIGIKAGNLEQSYRNLHELMKVEDWESTDEVYDPEGNLIPEKELSSMRMKVLQEKTN